MFHKQEAYVLPFDSLPSYWAISDANIIRAGVKKYNASGP